MNWRSVSPNLLSRLNSLGRNVGQVVTLTSGFRTHEEQRYLYRTLKGQNPNAVVAQPGSSRHESGQAVDALIGGSPVGSAVDEGTLNRAGLRSLSSIGDPVHVEPFVSEGAGPEQPRGGKSGRAPGPPVPDFHVTASSETSATTPTASQPNAPTEDTESFDIESIAQLWQQIGQLPGAAPETLALARRYQLVNRPLSNAF